MCVGLFVCLFFICSFKDLSDFVVVRVGVSLVLFSFGQFSKCTFLVLDFSFHTNKTKNFFQPKKRVKRKIEEQNVKIKQIKS